MSSTELIEYEAGDQTYMIPAWLRNLSFITDEQMEAMQIAQIYGAATTEEALPEVEGAEKLDGKGGEVWRILSVGWRPSTMEENPTGVFALFTAETPAKGIKLFSCGAPKVVAQLDRIVADKRLPAVVRIWNGVPKQKGWSAPLGLTLLPDSAYDF